MSPAPDAYTQGERFQVEKRRLFAKTWLPFCAAGQIATAGSFVAHALGGWPIFAIRGADGAARAFRNLCRHQGMPVIEKPAGQCDVLRCRYHGWTYDHTGALISAPPLVAPEDPGAAMHHLDGLVLVEAEGMIQVRGRGMGDAPAPAFGLGDQVYADALATDIDANWKAVIEALLLDTAWRFVWPLAFVGIVGAGPVVRQIVPRSFSRTRIVDLMFVGAARDLAEREAQRAKADALRFQAARAAGDAAVAPPLIEAFWTALAACGIPDAAAGRS
jgi:nitrite reductase/ring-hydroxylating ferredoxin subunit